MTQMLTSEDSAAQMDSADDRGPNGYWIEVWRRLSSNWRAMTGLAFIVLLVFLAAFGPWIAPHDFLSQNLDIRNAGPSFNHPFGTDDLGRDILSRVVYGTRTALIVAVVVTSIAVVIGLVLGTVSAYAGGWVDRVIMWVTEITMSVPGLLLVIVINTSLAPPIARWMDGMYAETLNPIWRQTSIADFILVFGSMALITWPEYARLIRGQVLSVRKRQYVTAARGLGLPTSAILLRHVIPNSLGPIIVAVSAGLGTAMVLESAFSFLGMGVRPPIPSWGNMIADGLRVWRNYPYQLIAPATALGLATIAFSFVGDGLNDALNPKRRSR